MARHAMPLIINNLGGEMVYILEQRLEAQAVPADKAKKGTGSYFQHTRIS
jgi:hypothetical protein